MNNNIVTHVGSCHCNEVQFEATGEENIEVIICSCSICSINNYKHYIVPKESFKLLKGKNCLTTYTFNTKLARHMFCNVCGVKSFYTPRSHQNSISININCINSDTVKNIKIINFDGKNWDKNIAKIT